MIAAVIALAPVAIWAYLLLGRGGFWLCRERDDAAVAAVSGAARSHAPGVVAVIPARDEAETIAASVAALLTQEYEGRLSLVIVDDQSTDGTAAVAARSAAALGESGRLRVIGGTAPPRGWTGKLWAMRQGLDAVDAGHEPPDFVLFADADIAFGPRVLSRLVAIARQTDAVLVSLMARLRAVSAAERLLAPAFVFFFAMLYPFAWVNDPRRQTAAAAGGCMLVRREALAAAGGLDSLRDALIDDCALGAAMKRQGPIWLGLSDDVLSLRAHPNVADFGAMIVRSAYAELRYSPIRLVGAVAGMAVTYVAPPVFALLGEGLAQLAGLVAWAMMVAAYAPMLRFYRQPVLSGLAMPVVAAAYTAFTIESALQFWRGRGGRWKGRYQASTRGTDCR